LEIQDEDRTILPGLPNSLKVAFFEKREKAGFSKKQNQWVSYSNLQENRLFQSLPYKGKTLRLYLIFNGKDMAKFQPI
jgi:hypothetical protein